MTGNKTTTRSRKPTRTGPLPTRERLWSQFARLSPHSQAIVRTMICGLEEAETVIRSTPKGRRRLASLGR
jgi:hypothetical protein